MTNKMLPLKHQVILLISTLGICIMIVSFYSMHSYSSLQAATLKSNQELYSNHVLNAAEKNFVDIKNIASSIAYNQVVQQYLMEKDIEKKFNSYQQVVNLLNNTKTLNNSIIDFAIIGNSNNSANLSGDISTYLKLYDSTIQSSIQSIQFLNISTLLIGIERYVCQIAAMPIYQLSTTGKLIGVLFIAINPTSIIGTNSFTDSLLPTELVFVNSKNQLILGRDEFYTEINQANKMQSTSDTFHIVDANQTYNCQSFYVEAANGTLYTLVNQSIYSKKIKDMVLHQSALIIIIFIITVALLLIFFKSITSSLGQLTNIMSKISSGKRTALKERIPIDYKKHTCREVYSIAASYNEMMDEISVLNHDIISSYSKMYELEMINRKTEIAYLRSQINPHFLYNTLTLINGMASMNESEGIIDIAQALSQLYRYSIKGNDIVTVRQELSIIKSYVMIQMTRFENRFTVDYDFTEEVYDALIPRMIMQPLVENSITHGLEKCLKNGRLTIGGRKNYTDNTLVLWIYDTGVGMSTERLMQIRQLLANNISNHDKNIMNQVNDDLQNSVGLCNVNSRIFLYYGDPNHLHIDSEDNVGTNVQIKIPYNK